MFAHSNLHRSVPLIISSRMSLQHAVQKGTQRPIPGQMPQKICAHIKLCIIRHMQSTTEIALGGMQPWRERDDRERLFSFGTACAESRTGSPRLVVCGAQSTCLLEPTVQTRTTNSQEFSRANLIPFAHFKSSGYMGAFDFLEG
jgi:hypothetical protein